MNTSRFEVHQRREWLDAIPSMIAIVQGLRSGCSLREIARENGVRIQDVLRVKLEMEQLDA